jgi:hypothetical protein
MGGSNLAHRTTGNKRHGGFLKRVDFPLGKLEKLV